MSKSDKNIGCDWSVIAVRLNQLFGNAQYWIEHETSAPDELAARFHHALVWIHPFPNGNGRHARMMADALLKQLGRPVFSWEQRRPGQRQRGAGSVSRGIARCGSR